MILGKYYMQQRKWVEICWRWVYNTGKHSAPLISLTEFQFSRHFETPHYLLFLYRSSKYSI